MSNMERLRRAISCGHYRSHQPIGRRLLGSTLTHGEGAFYLGGAALCRSAERERLSYDVLCTFCAVFTDAYGGVQVPYTPWLPQEHGGEPTAAAAYATAEAAATARGSHTCGEVRSCLQVGEGASQGQWQQRASRSTRRS